MSLNNFADDYGKYPDDSTAMEVRRRTGSTLSLSDNTSNDLFVQLLLAVQITRPEEIYYAKTKSSIKPDNVWSSDATALAHGECAFAYVMGVNPNDNRSTPIAFGPVIPGTKTFDGKANYDRIAVVRADNSVVNIPIDSAGKAIINGLDLLDPRQPFWHGKAPDVKWPK